LNNNLFIENIVRQNIPINGNTNYAAIQLIIANLKSKYTAVPYADTTFSTAKIESAAKSVYDLYKAQL
jgi:hypothetical protein